MLTRIRALTLIDFALVLSVTALVVVTMWLVFTLTSDEEWRPLGPFPEQQVDAADTFEWYESGPNADPVRIPSASVRTPVVDVTGTKCYREPVAVAGDVRWSTVDPRGGSWQTGSGSAVREAGCHTNTYLNEVPEQVLHYQADIGGPVVVTISGCETPTDPDLGEGATLCWTTEPFALVP